MSKGKIMCGECLKMIDVNITEAQIRAHKTFGHFQKEWDALTDDERDLIKSETCSDCWERKSG